MQAQIRHAWYTPVSNMRTLLIVAAGTILAAQTPIFRASTRLIQVSVIVTDHRGDPVTGLNQDDFTVFDQGRRQKIVFFSEQSPGQEPAAAQGDKLAFANRLPAAGSATVVLFDRLNTRLSEAAFARARVAKFLDGVRPDDRIALYGLSTDLIVLHDFTEDPAELVRALNLFRPVQSQENAITTFEESNTGHPGMDWFENKGDQKASDTEMVGRVEITSRALVAIANHLAGMPGRKNLVWVSGSFPISIGYLQKRIMGARPEKDTFDGEVQMAARALSNANVAIYPVDAHVLGTLGGAYDARLAPKPGLAQLQNTIPMPEMQPIAELGTMDTLAEETGGRVFAHTNDIEGAVRKAIDDSRFSYTLAYYPDHDQWDGRFREIKVKVGRAGVEVRHRRGYLAVAETAPAPAPVALSEVIRRPIESGELGITVQLDPLGGRRFKLHLTLDTSAMRFEQKDGRWDGQVEVLFVQLGRDDNDVASYGQTLTFRLSPQTHMSATRDGLKISATETIEEHATELRVAARDQGTGAAGSVYIPVTRILR